MQERSGGQFSIQARSSNFQQIFYPLPGDISFSIFLRLQHGNLYFCPVAIFPNFSSLESSSPPLFQHLHFLAFLLSACVSSILQFFSHFSFSSEIGNHFFFVFTSPVKSSSSSSSLLSFHFLNIQYFPLHAFLLTLLIFVPAAHCFIFFLFIRIQILQ